MTTRILIEIKKGNIAYITCNTSDVEIHVAVHDQVGGEVQLYPPDLIVKEPEEMDDAITNAML